MPVLERLLRPDDSTVAVLLGVVALYAIVGAWMGRAARTRIHRDP